MRLIEAFVQNPVKVSVGVLLVALFGMIAAWRMPMQLTPEVEIPKISIETRWPGASPHEIEREIVQEQEEQLQSVEGVTKLSSQCANSVGTITLEFKVGSDLTEGLLKVNSRLQQVPEYPEEADQPVISTSDPRANAIGWFILRPRVASAEEIEAFLVENPDLRDRLQPVLAAHNSGLRTRRFMTLVEEHPELAERVKNLLPPDIDVPGLRLWAEDFIEARFERVPGVSNANVYGGREDELQVVVDPQKLAARGVTILDVRNALRRENRDISAGDIWEGKRQYVIRTLGRFRNLEQVADVILTQSPDGAPVYIRDVAEVRKGFKKPDAVVKNFGTACLAINCVRETGANVLDVMKGLREVNADLNRDLLKREGLELIQVYDQTDYIYSAVKLVNQNIVIGGALTIIVLLLFLRSGRSTIVIALAIPTSLIGTFLMLNLMGRSLNVISLAGLAFAVGMLVDNAVVVLENCYRHSQMGDDPFAAAVRGAKEVWGAVVASTLTTLAVFLPVLFIEEEAGQLFRDIALAVSSAVGLSLIVSISVIPTAAARLLRQNQRDPDEAASERSTQPATIRGPFGWMDTLGRSFVDSVVGINRFLQRGILPRLVTVVVLVGLAVALSWWMMPQVEYLPAGNRNLVIAILLPPPGYNIDRALEIGTKLEEATRPYWDVMESDTDGGAASKKLDFPQISDYFFVARGRQVFMGLRAMNADEASRLVDLVYGLTAELPGTITRASQRSLFSRELATGRTVDIEITGPELETLVAIGREIFFQLLPAKDDGSGGPQQVVPGNRAFPIPSLDVNSPELRVLRKSEQAADLGISTDELGYTVDALIDGAYATDYYMDNNKIDLTIVGSKKFANRTQDLSQLFMATPSGDLVRLDALADVVYAGGPEQINRRERQRAITVSVTPPPEMPLEQAINEIQEKIVRPRQESGAMGDEYQIHLAGTADKLQATWKALRWNFVLALLVTYLLMAALFESWIYPFVIILSVPLGAVGGLIGLVMLNQYLALLPNTTPQTLDVLTMLGFVILIGTVVNNPILIIHQTLNHIREEDMTPNEAILASVRTRIRPIFMTTSTTVLGLSPLVFFPGAGSELYRGLGAVVLGGLLVSTVFTLIMVPTLFSLMMQAKEYAGTILNPTKTDAAKAASDH